MEWSIQDIGAIGELIGSIAVLITLIYLAVQVQFAKQNLKRSVSQERMATSIALQRSRVTNEELRRAYLKTGEPAFYQEYVEEFDLTTDEADMLVWDRVAYWQYHSHTTAYIDELPGDERAAFDAPLALQYSSPFISAWYERSKRFGVLNTGATRYIGQLLSS